MSRSCLLIVGLGNPGRRYERTRHNVGFRVVDILAERQGVSFRKPVFSDYLLADFHLDLCRFYVCKPLSYMNRSGRILGGIMRRTGAKASDVVVVVDNVDLPPAALRFKKGGGGSTHNGLRSINSVIAASEYLRLYVGVGNSGKQELARYVLSPWPEGENTLYEQAFVRAAEHLEQLASKPLEFLMNSLNEKTKKTQ